jgi:hypothetical protein
MIFFVVEMSNVQSPGALSACGIKAFYYQEILTISK